MTDVEAEPVGLGGATAPVRPQRRPARRCSGRRRRATGVVAATRGREVAPTVRAEEAARAAVASLRMSTFAFPRRAVGRQSRGDPTSRAPGRHGVPGTSFGSAQSCRRPRLRDRSARRTRTARGRRSETCGDRTTQEVEAAANPSTPSRRSCAGRCIMNQDWRDLSFIHWAVQPDRVRHLMPAGVEPDTLEGSTYVGLVPVPDGRRRGRARTRACRGWARSWRRTSGCTPWTPPGAAGWCSSRWTRTARPWWPAPGRVRPAVPLGRA